MDQIWPNLAKKMSEYMTISPIYKNHGSATDFFNGNSFLTMLTTEN